MAKNDLKEILPAYGDEIAVKNFAKQSISSGKQSLIERLKQKINKELRMIELLLVITHCSRHEK